MYPFCFEEPTIETMTFKDFMTANKDTLKANMIWNNYGLNNVLLPVSEELKEKALQLLTQNYGKYQVGDILDEMQADVSVNFPLLMQSLSVSTSMTYQSTNQTDNEHEIRTVTEAGSNKNNTTQTNNSQRDTAGKASINENNTIIGEIKNTGTVDVHETSARIETNTLDANNTSSTPSTGSKNVALSHSMPEQSISGITDDFTRDAQGTPDLNTSTVQSASENYSTINQFENTQIIDQTQSVDSDITNDNTRTDNTTQATNNTAETISTNDTTAQETITAGTIIEGTNEIEHTTTDEINRELVNKQYAQEISKILENVHSVKSFNIWVDAFSWLCGVV